MKTWKSIQHTAKRKYIVRFRKLCNIKVNEKELK